MGDFGDFIVYVDESGDHGAVSKDFPVFVLAFLIFNKKEYAEKVTTALTNLKFKWFGHDAVVLHEREIRKQQAPFAFLTRADLRAAFMADIGSVIVDAPFTLIASVIQKDRIKNPESWPAYATAMQFGLERVAFFLKDQRQAGRTTHVVFERRGKVEDDELELAFRRLESVIASKGGGVLDIVFAPKSANHCGHQLADLIARPIGQHVMRPDQPNRTWPIIVSKFRRAPSGAVEGYGLKIFP